MHEEMKKQEEIYAKRQEKYRAAVEKLRKQKESWKSEVASTTKQAEECQKRLEERTKELEAKEALLANREAQLDARQKEQEHEAQRASNTTEMERQLQNKINIISALRSEMVSLERAHEANMQHGRESARSEIRLLTQKHEAELQSAREEMQTALDQLRSKHEEELQSLARSFEQREKEWNELFTQQSEQCDRAAQQELEAEQQMKQVMIMKEDIEARETKYATAMKELDEQRASYEASAAKLKSDRSELHERINAHERSMASHAETVATFQQQRDQWNEEYTRTAAQQAEIQSKLDEDVASLKQEQLKLAEEKETLQREQEELKQAQEKLQQREKEFDEAVQQFDAHMSARESSASEWEARLKHVESEYSTEFTKMNQETSRLALWESELQSFQQSLFARERHIRLVERNLGEYLEPFDQSSILDLNASTNNASMLLMRQSQGMAQREDDEQQNISVDETPQRMDRAIKSKQYHPQQHQHQHQPQQHPSQHQLQAHPSRHNSMPTFAPMTPAQHVALSSPGLLSPRSLAAPVLSPASLPRPSPPSSMPSARSAVTPLPRPAVDLYSPTQAEISITDECETSFSQA